MKYIILIIFMIPFATGCSYSDTKKQDPTTAKDTKEESYSSNNTAPKLTLEKANYLARLPLKCIENEYPYKRGIVLTGKEDLTEPIDEHPAFYGCFDWHSAVHAHWSLLYLLKNYPSIENADKIKEVLLKNLSKENIDKELAYFLKNKFSKSFERTYGWAWLLKLAEEAFTWDTQEGKALYSNLKPLTGFISTQYKEYLPKLIYPIRVGEHSNTAFGLSFAYDYAVTTGDRALKDIISNKAKEYYSNDSNCPITWEPSGYDFLSPCLQEVDIMRKILETKEFETWLSSFLPDLMTGQMQLNPAKVSDRTDGKLVHLDGLNFSRAWCLYPLAGEATNVTKIATEHLNYSIEKIVDGDYAGEHWLASFALYAYKSQSN